MGGLSLRSNTTHLTLDDTTSSWPTRDCSRPWRICFYASGSQASVQNLNLVQHGTSILILCCSVCSKFLVQTTTQCCNWSIINDKAAQETVNVEPKPMAFVMKHAALEEKWGWGLEKKWSMQCLQGNHRNNHTKHRKGWNTLCRIPSKEVHLRRVTTRSHARNGRSREEAKTLRVQVHIRVDKQNP